MKILIAPDKFKGSLSAFEVADSIEKGILKVFPEAVIEKVPMADGGEGTVESLVDATGGKIIKTNVKDPLFRDIESFYGILGDGKTAVIEMAAASGLYLLKDYERNPMITTTYGTGQLVKDALDRGCRKFIIAIGGSATNDGGAGMAMVLGVKFYDEDGREIGLGGGELSKIYSIDTSNLDDRLKECEFIVACDVANPLIGENGASRVYAPQKGATKEMVEVLDKNLEHYGKLLEKYFNKKIIDVPGSGAAGGLGAGLMAFLNAQLKSGIEIIIETLKLEEKIKEADIVISGEGKIDFQTAFGKTISGIAKLCKKHNKPLIVIAGMVEDIEKLYEIGVSSVFSTMEKPMSLEDAIKNAPTLLEKSAERIFRLIKAIKA
ncbi:glycerate kinase [Thermoanaerobacter thermohydrosulfuricus]|uniref:Glycerate kinase n=2 Tax=Thermoanaerobacter thermohydrosulfuricus TaxID=1516 RepID=M8CNX8_THETY|nr:MULTISPECIES: glycerate kinase [Thermoanaerobacter]EMT38830.1 glycerate kinase [Thermoanaerobacter thermohydrosulfuricus WC1]SDG00848.1 glycerate kinase [Thermoanaerobacter thermohydrosulfuricus]SFE45406.1 glycerate kinase [Thermoanaerobacter thermohydrosulfuricus]